MTLGKMGLEVKRLIEPSAGGWGPQRSTLRDPVGAVGLLQSPPDKSPHDSAMV